VRIIGGPEVAPDGQRVAFSVEQRGTTRLYVMNADGTSARVVTDSLELSGTPAWAPDGQSITSAASVKGTPQLFRVSLDGVLSPFVRDYAVDPVWSPGGDFLVYSGADIGTTFPVKGRELGRRSPWHSETHIDSRRQTPALLSRATRACDIARSDPSTRTSGSSISRRASSAS